MRSWFCRLFFVYLAYIALYDVCTSSSEDLSTAAENAAVRLTTAQCKARYAQRTFVPLDQAMQNFPPVLLSFPGSGNTWLRSLIEYATGYYSGSIDVDDDQLKAILKGENSCGMRMCIIKGHPHDLVLKQEREKPSGWVYRIRFTKKNQRKKCNRGLVQYFKRVLMLVRSPFDAILAEYQRSITGLHTGVLTVAYITENATEWRNASLHQARHYSDKMKKMIYPMFQHYPSRDITTVRFEDLINKGSRTRILEGVIRFLNYSKGSDWSQRVQCAFLLADSDKITTRYAFRDREHYCAISGLLATFNGNFSYSHNITTLLPEMSCA